MRYEQANKRVPRTDHDVWRPDRLRSLIDTTALERLRYVVVDDLDGDLLELIAHPWPHLALDGSLIFDTHLTSNGSDEPVVDDGPDPYTEAAWIRFEAPVAGSLRRFCQQAVNQARAASAERTDSGMQQDAETSEDTRQKNQRRLRVGDAFAMGLRVPVDLNWDLTAGRTVLGLDPDEDIAWLVDVTLEARQAAKAALFGAISRPESQQEATRLDPMAHPTAHPGPETFESGEEYEAEMRRSEEQLRAELRENGIELRPGGREEEDPDSEPPRQQAFPTV